MQRIITRSTMKSEIVAFEMVGTKVGRVIEKLFSKHPIRSETKPICLNLL